MTWHAVIQFAMLRLAEGAGPNSSPWKPPVVPLVAGVHRALPEPGPSQQMANIGRDFGESLAGSMNGLATLVWEDTREWEHAQDLSPYAERLPLLTIEHGTLPGEFTYSWSPDAWRSWSMDWFDYRQAWYHAAAGVRFLEWLTPDLEVVADAILERVHNPSALVRVNGYVATTQTPHFVASPRMYLDLTKTKAPWVSALRRIHGHGPRGECYMVEVLPEDWQ